MADSLDQYDPVFQAAGQEWNVDWRALKAIAAQESGGNPNAVSKAGALGVMQLMPATARGLGVTDPSDPAQSIYGAAKLMSQALTAENEDPRAALLYYHGGPGWRQRYGPESAAYVPSVSAHYQQYAKADTGTATDATPAPVADDKPAGGSAVAQSDDPFSKALQTPAASAGTPGKAAGGDAQPDAPDPFTAALGKPGEGAPPPEEGQTTARGVARNAAAGVLEGSGAAINVLHDPVGNLILRPLATLGAAGYDWLAPHVGLPQLTPEQRADLTGDDPQYPQPGSALAQAAGAGDVTPATPTEAAVRQGTAGAVAATALAPGGIVVPATVGAGGALAGNAAAAAVPPQYAPAAALAGNVVGGAIGGVAGVGAVRAGNALAGAAREVASAPVPEHPLAPQPPPPTPVDPLAARVAEVTGRPALGSGEAQPAPANQNAPQPQAAGAQATPQLAAGMTPREIADYQKTAEGTKLLEGQIIGEPDRKQYLPGVLPNAAEQEQTVTMARELKALGIAEPKVAEEAKLAAQDNAKARTDYLRDTVGTAHDIRAEDAARQADIQQDKGQVFAPSNLKGLFDPEPVTNAIDAILSEKTNKQNSALQAELPKLRERLINEDGTPKIIDPEEAWGLRQDIDRLTDKRMAANNPNLHFVGHQLDTIAGEIDKQIENVAPGYDQMLAKYKTHSQRINELTALQAAEPSLIRGPNANMTFNDMQRFMRQVVKGRSSPSYDLNAFKTFSPETMERLWNLRDDLRRSSSAMELARAAGSDTTPNFMDVAKQYAKLGGTAGVHAVANAISPGFGSMGVSIASHALKPIRAQRLQAKQLARGRQLLYPTNPLQNPNAAP